MPDKMLAVLVSLDTTRTSEEATNREESLEEVRALCHTLGANLRREFHQVRKSPNSRFYIGGGKVDEIAEYIQEYPVDAVIFDAKLSASQTFHLSKAFGVEVLDRTKLILDIFKHNAKSNEARLQVELASLNHEMPLIREYIHKARMGEHPGFMAGGEYQIDYYYDMIRRQIKKIKTELDGIARKRNVRRKHRRRKGYYLVSLAGYTNAGKSSLMNMLAGETVTVDDMLFSTLSTTTAKLPTIDRPVLLTDTVGFLRNLPPELIDAFHSTLEEIGLSDTILLVIDASNEPETATAKFECCMKILKKDIAAGEVIAVLNKIDKVEKEHVECVLEEIKRSPEAVLVSAYTQASAVTKKGKDGLFEAIVKSLPPLESITLNLKDCSKTQSFISWLYDNTYVDKIEYPDATHGDVIVTLECEKKHADAIRKRASTL